MLSKAGGWFLLMIAGVLPGTAFAQNSFSISGLASGPFAPDEFNGLNAGSAGFVSASLQLVSNPVVSPASGAISIQVSNNSGFLTVSTQDCSGGPGTNNVGSNSTPLTLFVCVDNSQIQRGYNLGLIIVQDLTGVIPEFRFSVLVIGVPTGEIKTNPGSPIALSSDSLMQNVAVTFNSQNGAAGGQPTTSDTVQSITIDPSAPDEGKWLQTGGNCLDSNLMASGQTSCLLTLTVDPTKLSKKAQVGQTYTSDVTITMSRGDRADLQVTFNYSHLVGPALQFTSPATFTGVAGQPFTATITASGGVSPYTYSATGLPSGLSINPTTGVISGSVSMGTYMPTVSVKDSAGTSQSEQITITIQAAVPPLAFTSSITFNGTAGQPFAATITASGGVPPYTYSATGLPTGLSINSTTGVISGSVSMGTYTPTVSVKDSAGTSTSEQITILIQAAGPPLQITSATSFTGTAGQIFSATITATGGLPPYTFQATGLPSGLNINSGTGVISGSVSAGTFTPTVSVKDSAGASASEQITITITSAPAVPVINTSGIVNNASFAPGTLPLAPGVMAAVFGTNLTDGSSCLAPTCSPTFGNNGWLNTTLAGAQVTVNGIAAPIFYASPTQIGIEIPTELNGNSAAVQVSVGNQASLVEAIQLDSASPGIFTTTANGKGVGAINHANGSAVTAENPAHPGEVVIIYATGLGQVQPEVPTGELPSSTAVTTSPVTVSIDGVSVVPEFAGLSGCCVGENQVNVRIPDSTRSADGIPVVVSIGGKQSNPVTISVRPQSNVAGR